MWSTRTFEFQRIDLGNEIPDIIVGKSSDRTCNSHATIVEQGQRIEAKNYDIHSSVLDDEWRTVQGAECEI